MGFQAGESRISNQTIAADDDQGGRNEHVGRHVAEPVRTNRGVKKADRAVPPMPAPKTPVANPRGLVSNQAFTNGMPTAKVVPADAQEEAEDQQQRIRLERPAKATSSTGIADARVSTVNISRPP